ncbi:MAG: AsmA-like C-terminal region-containing protein [Cryomorphaceae bacterium]
MKKALKIIGIIVVVLFLAILIIPFAFKGKIVNLVKEEANKNLNARVEFNDVSLSLIRNFPNLSVGIEELSVVGIETFEQDTLASMKNLSLTVDLMSVISGDQIKIKKVALESPRIQVLVREDGAANYDIAKETADTTAVEEPDSASEPVNLAIEEYSIFDGFFVYDDATLPMRLQLAGMNHTGEGNFAEDVFTLFTNTSLESADVVYDGVKYVRKTKADLKADIAMDLPNMKFTFMENELDINELILKFDGWLAMPEDDIDMDLTFSTQNNDLRALLSLVPAEFASDLEGVTADGSLDFGGYVKGVYNDNSMPGFGIDLVVDKGRIQYPDLPKSIENIQIDTHIKSPEGNDMDKLTVDVTKFHMELGKSATDPNTVHATLALKNPMSDPHINTRVDADLNLGSFKDVVPLDEDFELNGDLSAHFKLIGALSSIENQRFNEFEADGGAELKSFNYRDTDVGAEIPEAKMSFSPEKLTVETFKLIYEEINMSFDGYMENYVAYALTDTLLKGRFNFEADRLDVNKFMPEDSTSTEGEDVESETADTTASGDPFLVPANLDVILTATIGEVLYDEIVLSDITGEIAIQDEIAALREVKFKTLDGTIAMTGSYNTKNPEKLRADFAYDVKNVDIKKSAEAFNTVEKYAPISKHASGKISSDFVLVTQLNNNMEPIYETMNGRGTLNTSAIVLEGGKFLSKLSKTLKSPQLARQEVDPIRTTFVIENGKITTDPFDMKLNDITATVSGYTSFDETLDYNMKMKIPRKSLGGDFNKMAEGLLAQANSFLGGSMKMGEFINMDVRVHEDLYDPTITPSFAGMEGGDVKDAAKDAIKEKVKEEIDEKVDDAKEKAREEANEILADAQDRADQVKREAKKAADKLRSEADKQAQKLIDDAKNPISKKGAEIAAKKIRDEAEEKARKLESEADKRADAIMAEARKQADEKLGED